MKAVIYKNSEHSRILEQNIRNLLSNKFDFIAVTDDYSKNSIYHTYKRYTNGEIDKIIIPSARSRIDILNDVKECTDMGWNEKDIYIAAVELMKGRDISFDKSFMTVDKFNYMSILLTSVTEHCNLNCKGCSHFSPLVKEEVFLDYGRWEKDLSRMKEIIPHIEQMNFLGGEPLLHKEMFKFLYFARKIYPYTNIFLVTNGILLKQMPSELCEAIKKTGTVIYLSVYPKMALKVSEWVDFLAENHINYVLVKCSDFVPMLMKNYEAFPQDTTEFICSNCAMLQDGKLARCPMYFTVNHFNDSFKTNYPYQDGLIDIYGEELNSEKLFLELNKVHKLCNWCSRYKWGKIRTKKWECYSNKETRKAEDWLELQEG